MCFIVYILETEQHVAVPYSWIELNCHMEGMINNGVNANIIFVVYYTLNQAAFRNGIPRWDFQPNIHAHFNRQFPNEGWYHCRVKKFKGNKN